MSTPNGTTALPERGTESVEALLVGLGEPPDQAPERAHDYPAV